MLFAYAPIEPSAIPLLPIYLIASIIALFSLISISKRLKKKKNRAMFYLELEMLFLFISLLILFFGLLEAYITGEKREIYRFSLSFAYFLINIGNIFICFFGYDMFSERFQTYKIYIGFLIISAILVILPCNYYGFDPIDIPENLKNFRMISSGFMIAVSLILYIKIVILGRELSRQAENKQIKFSAKMISLAFSFATIFLILILIDTILFKYIEISAYSIILFFAWIMIVLFLITIYIGIILPDWIKKRIKIEDE